MNSEQVQRSHYDRIAHEYEAHYDDLQAFKKMTEALFEVIRGIGSKYRITFA